jgi:capsular polysaccharide biosynthesis protein
MPPSTRQQDPSWQGWQREQRDDLTLSEARHVLWERRALVGVCTLFFLAVALIYGLSREPVYTAETTLSVRSEEGIGPAGSFDEVLSGLRDSAAMDGLREEAAERAGWEASQSDFDERLEVSERVNNGEVKVRFSGTTPEEAAQGANAYAEAFVERVDELERRLAGGTVAVDAGVERAAEPPEHRSDYPKVFLAAVAAGGGGLIVGGMGALFLEGRARRWSGSKDAELTLRAPVLGVIPDFSDEHLSQDGGTR